MRDLPINVLLFLTSRPMLAVYVTAVFLTAIAPDIPAGIQGFLFGIALGILAGLL